MKKLIFFKERDIVTGASLYRIFHFLRFSRGKFISIFSLYGLFALFVYRQGGFDVVIGSKTFCFGGVK